MSFELFVALRYLFAPRKQAFISLISLISMAGVGIGVAEDVGGEVAEVGGEADLDLEEVRGVAEEDDEAVNGVGVGF